MNKEIAIKNAGGRAKLATLLGVTQAAVSQWGDNLPDARYYQLRVVRPRWFDKQGNILVVEKPARRRPTPDAEPAAA